MKKIVILLLLLHSLFAVSQNIISNGDFSQYNYILDSLCPTPTTYGSTRFTNWILTGGFVHFCHSWQNRHRDRDTIFTPGAGIMPLPKRGDGYAMIHIASSGPLFNKSKTPFLYLTAQELSTQLEKDSNYVFEAFIRPNPTSFFRGRQFSFGFMDYLWQAGLNVDTSGLIEVKDVTLDQIPSLEKWSHVRIDFVATGQEKILVLHNKEVDTALIQLFMQNQIAQQLQQMGITTGWHQLVKFLIDDVHLYKASDTIFSVKIGNDTLLCDGATLDLYAEPEGFKLEDTVTTWQWSTGDTTQSITINNPGTYWVEVRINQTYWARDTIVVEYESFPEWSKPFGGILEQCNDIGKSWEEVKGPELLHGGSYLWSTGGDEQIEHVSTPGLYWLEVQTPCYTESDTFELKQINCIESDPYIPSAFTPGGHNPLWIIGGLEQGARVEVFDRWGQRVFHSEDYHNNWWDGTYNGAPLPTGVYTYRIVAPREGRDPYDEIGTVTIVR